MRMMSLIDDRTSCLSLTSTVISIQPIPVPTRMTFPIFLSDIRLSMLFLVSISCFVAKSSPGQRITIRNMFSSCMVPRSDVLAMLPCGISSEQLIKVNNAIKNRMIASLLFMAWIKVCQVSPGSPKKRDFRFAPTRRVNMAALKSEHHVFY